MLDPMGSRPVDDIDDAKSIGTVIVDEHEDSGGTVMLGGEATAGGDGSTDGTSASTSREPHLRSGEQIGRYRLVRRLGAGGMGVVWVAEDPKLGRTVAIKVLHAQRRRGARTARERLRREALALARLSHPNVVSIYDVGIHEGRVFLAMEHIEGRTLDRWAETEPGLPQVLTVFEQAAAGLAAVHDAGFIHRDFKPANVMIDRGGRVLVMDFGLARIHDRQSVSEQTASASSSAWNLEGSRVFSTVLTCDGVIMGTPAYMAPEQHIGQEADAQADQFAFFATLHELLMGRRAFTGRSLEALAREKHEGRVDFSGGRLRMPRAVRALVRRGLDPEPARRHPGMVAVAQQLAALRQRPARSRLWAGLVVGGLAIGGMSWAGLASPTSDGCELGAERMAEVWNDSRRRELREAFAATELSYATDATARVVGRLDAYAEAWALSHQRACGVQGDPRLGLDLRMNCLNKARTSLGATVALLVEADSTVVQHAVAQVSGLPSLARCEDIEALRAQVPPPTDPVVAESIEAIGATIESAHALERAGHYERGRGLAVQALDDARTLGHESSVALALIRLASLDLSLGDADAAYQGLSEAALLAAGIGEHHAAADAATRLVYLCSERRGEPEEAMRWARHAEASLGRLPSDPLARARLDSNIGIVRSIEARYEEALVLYERAYEAKRGILGDQHPEVIGALENLALGYGEVGRPIDAERLQQRVVTMMDEVLGSSHPDYAHSLMNLGGAVDALGRHDEAAERYAEAMEVFRSSLGPRHPMVARTLSSLGHVASAQDRLPEAEDYYRRASELFEEILGPAHREFAWSLSDRAIVASQLLREEEALTLYARARTILESGVDSEHDSLAYLLMSEAHSLVELDRFSEAERSLDRARQIIDARLAPEHPARATWHANRGDLLGAQEDRLGAAAEYRRGLEIATASLGPEHPETASILLSLGTVEHESGETESARVHLRRAMEITEASPVGEAFRSAARFSLAKALGSDPSKGSEARRLARRAREGFAGYGELFDEDVAEIDAWMRQHRG